MEQKATRAKPRPGRRRRRILPIVGYMIVALALAWFIDSRATTTVIFVRHADTDAAMGEVPDPSLNARGQLRAQLLADFLQDVDVVASVDAIYASEFRRTQETAAPLAERLGLEVQIADHYRVEEFMDDVLREHRGKIVLIVSHSDAIAPLIDELHGSKRLPKFGPNDHDDVYIVTIPRFNKVKTLRLHYGQGLEHFGEVTTLSGP